MTLYDHILLFLQKEAKSEVFAKANLLASSFGARLTISYCLPHMSKQHIGAIDVKAEYREIFKTHLGKLGKLYKIPEDDQWLLSLDEVDSRKRLQKSGIDLIILDGTKDKCLQRSHLINKILPNYSGNIHFINAV